MIHIKKRQKTLRMRRIELNLNNCFERTLVSLLCLPSVGFYLIIQIFGLNSFLGEFMLV